MPALLQCSQVQIGEPQSLVTRQATEKVPIPIIQPECHRCAAGAVAVAPEMWLNAVFFQRPLQLPAQCVGSDFSNKVDPGAEGGRGASAVRSAPADSFGDRWHRGFPVLQ
jgi:hypothetical protein